jgi:hypothetical protein
MDIGVPIRDLGLVEAADLREAVLAQEATAWHENELRQNDYDVHYHTESIVFLLAALTWPEVKLNHEAGWDRLSSIALPIMEGILEKHYPPGGTTIRAVAAKLKAGANISPHIDTLTSFKYGHRIHIPITTNNRVRFMIDGRPYRFEIGHAYEINNLITHSVMNAGKEDRISFIFDHIPADIAEQQQAVFTKMWQGRTGG